MQEGGGEGGIHLKVGLEAGAKDGTTLEVRLAAGTNVEEAL